MKIALEDLEEVFRYLSEINKKDLKDIQWTRDGKVIDIPEEAIEEFQFIGLNNTDFFRRYYEGEGVVAVLVGRNKGQQEWNETMRGSLPFRRTKKENQ